MPCPCEGALRKRDQLIGVAERLTLSQNGVVARALGVDHQLPIGRPHQRVKPVQSACNAGQTERDPITSPDVLELMRERAAQVHVAPRPRVRRKENRRPHDTARDWTDDRFVHHDVDRAGESRPMRKIVRHHLRFAPWQPETAYAMNLPKADCDGHETADDTCQPHERQ
jgi:hypothetical protein